MDNRSIVVITGSSSGIGREAAFEFAKDGWGVVITYNRNKNDAIAAGKKCRSLGAASVLVVKLNLADNASIRSSVKKIVSKFGKINVLVNNAGVIAWSDLDGQSFADIENQVRTNLEGLIKITAECLPHVTGKIINISSGAGKSGYAGLATYCATKFGVRGFTQSLSEEHPELGVFSVNPGMTATRMTKFRGVPPEKVAAIIFNTAVGKYKIPSGGDVDVWEYL